jgi:hypothetical protein
MQNIDTRHIYSKFFLYNSMTSYVLYKLYAKVPSKHKASSNIVLHQEENNIID